jgi:hypothetical protein
MFLLYGLGMPKGGKLKREKRALIALLGLYAKTRKAELIKE